MKWPVACVSRTFVWTTSARGLPRWEISGNRSSPRADARTCRNSPHDTGCDFHFFSRAGQKSKITPGVLLPQQLADRLEILDAIAIRLHRDEHRHRQERSP